MVGLEADSSVYIASRLEIKTSRFPLRIFSIGPKEEKARTSKEIEQRLEGN
jgi:hypothetical protein